MTVEVTRTIVDGGGTRTETLTSKYQPWRAIYLVGSESDIPASARSATTDDGAGETGAAVEETPIDATSPMTGEIDADTGGE